MNDNLSILTEKIEDLTKTVESLTIDLDKLKNNSVQKSISIEEPIEYQYQDKLSKELKYYTLSLGKKPIEELDELLKKEVKWIRYGLGEGDIYKKKFKNKITVFQAIKKLEKYFSKKLDRKTCEDLGYDYDDIDNYDEDGHEYEPTIGYLITHNFIESIELTEEGCSISCGS